jgi:hypothetical protein
VSKGRSRSRARGRKDIGLRIARPERVLGLQRGDGVDGVRATQGLRCRFAQADVTDLALLDELGQRADRLLDGDVGIDAMLVVEVDVVGAEALERSFDRAADVLRRPVLTAHGRHVARVGGVHAQVELRRDDVLVAAALDRATDQQLVRQGAVDLRRVEEVDAEPESAMDRLDGLVLVSRAVESGHPHATEPDRGDLEVSKLAFFHVVTTLSSFGST